MVPESTFFNPKKQPWASLERRGRKKADGGGREEVYSGSDGEEIRMKIRNENIVVLVHLQIGGETTQNGTGP